MRFAALYDPLTMVQAQKWREYLNPLRGLTVHTVVAWLQQQQLGIVSNITWLYRFIEERDPTLSALIDRRTSAMEKLDWDIKVTPDDELPEGATAAMAKAQQQELQARYSNLDNLRDAVNFAALADFRGYSHLEKHYDKDGREYHLEPVPQWNWARSGLFGEWFYNQSAQAIPGPNPGLEPGPDLKAIEPGDFIIREVDRPIDVIAVFCFLRLAMGQKDWDGFMEVFGIPPIFLEMPPDVLPEKQAEFQAAAEAIVSDMRGTLPNGAKVQTVSPGSNSGNPFAEYMRYQVEQIVLKGTGGLLTMLTEAGSGTLAGGAHQDTFDTIAEAQARKISEDFQRQFDGPILEEKFPDQPKLAWFELAAKELTETSAVVADVASLSGAGLDVDPDQVEEKTGYRVTKAAPVDNPVVTDKGAPKLGNRARLRELLANRSDDQNVEKLIKTLGEHIDDESDGSWAPIMNRVQALLDGPDADFVANGKRFVADAPEMLKPTGMDDDAITAWVDALAAMLFNGVAAGAVKPAKKAKSAMRTPKTLKNGPTRISNGFPTRSRSKSNPKKAAK